MFPLVATEIGESDCAGAFINPLMTWLDTSASGYLAWSWNAFGACTAATMANNYGGQPYSLITDYATGTPNSAFAQVYHDHLMALP